MIAQRARYQAHAGDLEAAGMALLVKWLLRSLQRLWRRIVVLVDAKAMLYAAQRGRTSARSIQKVLRRLAALQIPGNLRLHFLYVPSEDNPADAPSRGLVVGGRARL